MVPFCRSAFPFSSPRTLSGTAVAFRSRTNSDELPGVKVAYNVQKKAVPLIYDDGLYLTFKDSGLEF